MMLHPPVLALLLAALLSAVTVSASGVFGWHLLRHWDLRSGAQRQIELERRTYLVATVLAGVLMLQGATLVLMVFNADRTAPLLVGAMCAFGSFNASVWGFPALYAKLALCFAGAVWLALHHVDQQARDYPLTRRKYALLLALVLPLALADAGLTTAYFLDLKPATLTSCCGSAFKPEREGLGADAAGLNPQLALGLLYGSFAVLAAWAALARRHTVLAVGYGLASAVFLVIGLTTVVSAVSLYIYEHPHHHCPFCLLKREYGYFGFLLYPPLLAGAAAGLASGVLSIQVPVSLRRDLPPHLQRLRQASLLGFGVFAALCAWAVGQSGLRL